MKKIKYIKRQDSGFKLSSGNSGETSLNLSNEIFDFISQGELVAGEEKDISFRIYKEDYIKAISFIITKLPLYKSSSTYSNKVDNYLSTFSELYSKIESFFGNNESTDYKVNLFYRPDGRIYLKSLRVNGFSIRDFLVENFSAIQFDDEDNGFLNLRILSDIEDNGASSEQTETSQEELLRQKTAAKFLREALEKVIQEDTNLSRLAGLKKYKETSKQLKINGFGLWRRKDLLPFRLDDVYQDLQIEYNGQDYVMYLEWSPANMENLFFPVFNSAYNGMFSMVKEGEEYVLYKISKLSKGGKTEEPLQQIFYGAPGTGKSNTIKREVDDKGLPNVRTTFHPDTDYSTFVGAYKPTSIDVPVMTMIGTKAVPVENSDGTPRMEKKIVYEFVPQAFLKAYAEAWKNQDEPFFLIIEEINRGNCAQIFGDLFQLLDRNDETGLSDYPISPDEDIRKFLQTDKKYGFAALTEEQKAAIPEKVLSGEWMILPGNLHIWATMNTSDQSLFPIDSAFKRRWDWQYMPISDGKKDWKIEVNGKRYDWWLFLVKINEKISDTTNSEDKKLGYYFCKAKNGKIDVETFVGKVIFYLWNDVFKDFAEEAGDLFQDEDGLLTFNKFYMVDTDGKTRVVEDKVELFLKNLGVEEDEVIEYMQDDEAEAMPTDRATDASNRLHVVFSDGETIRIQTGKEYVDVLKKIGLDKAYEIAKSKNPGILKCAFVTKEKEDAIENSPYLRYETIGEYHVVRGMSGDTMRPFLEKISNRYNLGLKFYRQ